MKKTEISVLIVDDHDLIRQGLKRIINYEEDIEIVGEAENGQKAIILLNILRPDVVLLDMKMPVMDGFSTLSEIKKINMNIKVIMLTVENDSKFVYDSIHTGADGYILKESAGEEIVNAIKSVYYGDKFIDKSLVSILFSNIQKKERKDSKTFNSLSKREVEVLYFISKGLSNKEIGKKLFLSEKTVKNYATNIFKKINVGDRVQATIFAIENQINEYFSENRD